MYRDITMIEPGKADANLLSEALRLPGGAVLKNRMVKAAMSDGLGDGQGSSTDAQARLYETWAMGGAALTIIGEAQIMPDHPEKPGNLVLAPGMNIASLRRLAERGSTNGTHIWPQLGHAGALSHAPISSPKGPSALNVEGLSCAALTEEEIAELPAHYAQAASLAKRTGFTGVQIHAGHGFLLSQFLSPLFNKRKDGCGGPVSSRFRIIGEIIDAVRRSVGVHFPVGIKINSTDNLVGGLIEAEALDVVKLLDATSIDLIDISGGTYFPNAKSGSDSRSAKGPYFESFAHAAKAITSKPIMLTGGFRNREQAVSSLSNGAADLIGLARALVLDPGLPNKWMSEPGNDPDFPIFKETPSGGVTAWYSMRLRAIGENREPAFDLDAVQALREYEAIDEARICRWLERFPLLSG
jgi:2,4-dienoyl-CoA reductase-like NADH-dependent reductase (Old Yellow Enzyme family)